MGTVESGDYQTYFKRRFEHCRILLALSEEQHRAITGNNLDELLSIIGRKQRVLTLMETEKEQNPSIWENWQSDREELDTDTRSRCERFLAETESLLAALVQLEQQGTSQLQKNRDETQQQLEQISQSLHANDAYQDKTDSRTHRFLDVGR